MDKIRFAVIGCGHIGSRHLSVLDNESRAELVAVCDIDVDKCEKFSTLYNVPSFQDYHEMLRSANIDVVNICTPHGLHAGMAIDAANAGKNILVEKPMQQVQIMFP